MKEALNPNHKHVFLIISAFLLVAVVVSIIYTQFNPSTACAYEVNPVCGADRVSYANTCLAQQNGTSVVSKGYCSNKIPAVSAYVYNKSVTTDGVSACTDSIQLACGIDGVTYLNPCNAASKNVTIAYIGNCDTSVKIINGTTCDSAMNFVCGYPGLTYQNSCLADFYDAKILSVGRCPDCSEIKPVCGVDKVSYRNECSAKEHLVAVDYQGRCI